MSRPRIVVVLGTRPEIIKLGPIIDALGDDPLIVHTGQHYDIEMADTFFEAFGIAPPRIGPSVGGKGRGQQIGNAISQLDELLATQATSAVVVQGDTNTTLAGAIAANARAIPLVHVEAGLRSRDRRMPEEHNRVLTDHLSDLCLAPTDTAARNLLSEGIDESRIKVTGNTVVDAVERLCPDPESREGIRARYGVEPGRYVLSTFHRPENVDEPQRLQEILDELGRIGLPALLPLHPRTRRVAEAAGISWDTDAVRVVAPIGYVDFLGLLADSALAVADSGGLQEEVSVLKRPMVVVRRSTERPEVLGTFCSLVSVGPEISATARRWLTGDPHTLDELSGIGSPFGDGRSGERCVTEILTLIDSRT